MNLNRVPLIVLGIFIFIFPLILWGVSRGVSKGVSRGSIGGQLTGGQRFVETQLILHSSLGFYVAVKTTLRYPVSACTAEHSVSLMNNLIPRAHVPFGQHQDTELWNNQFPETKILGLPVSRRMCGLVYMASRDKVNVDTFHQGIQYALEKLEESQKFGFEGTAVSNFKSKRHEGSGNELVDYSRAPCLDQKACGLWERDCLMKRLQMPP